jgi:hypothetical protein
MSSDMIQETVGVEAGFWGGKVYPLRFIWNGRRHEVKRVNLVFERRDGGRKYLCFAVDTGGMVAELVMDTQNFQFSIASVQAV